MGKICRQVPFTPLSVNWLRGKIAQEDLDIQLRGCKPNTSVCCVSHPDSFNNMIGHKAVNKKYFSSAYPDLRISYKADGNMRKGTYSIKF